MIILYLDDGGNCDIAINADDTTLYSKGLFIGGKLASLGGTVHLGETISIPRSYEIFYQSSIKKFVMSLEKQCLIKHFL